MERLQRRHAGLLSPSASNERIEGLQGLRAGRKHPASLRLLQLMR